MGVFLSSDSSDGPWEEVLHQTLEDSRQQADPLPLQTFPFSARTAKFVKFNQISYYGIGGGLQYFRTTTQGIPSVVREDSYPSYPDRGLTFSVRNLLTNAREIFGKNYWLAPDKQESAEFVLDLGYEKTVNMVELVNTHNGYHRDRSMKEFKVFLSIDSSDGPWEEVLHQTLEDSRQQADPLPHQTFPFSARTAKFIKFNQISYYGLGGGLQYFRTTTRGIPSVVREDSYPSYPDRGLTFSVRNLLTNAREIFGKNYWPAPDK